MNMVTRPRVTSVPNPTPIVRYDIAPQLFNPLWGAVLAKVYWLGVLVGVSVLIVGALVVVVVPSSFSSSKKKSVFYDATRPLLRPFLQMHVISTHKKKEDPFRGAWCFPAKKKRS